MRIEEIPYVNNPASHDYRPTGWFWRKEIAEAKSINEVRELARSLVLELEIHKRFIRECGHIPPKATMTASECDFLGIQAYAENAPCESAVFEAPLFSAAK